MNDILIRQLNNLQKQVDALVKPEVGRWVDWTPTVTQNVAVGVTVTYARYFASNKKVDVTIHLDVTGTGTANNNILISFPAGLTPIQSSHIGSGYIFDSSAGGIYFGSLFASGANFRLRLHSLTTATFVGVNPNFGLANGDIISFSGKYEVS